MKQTLNLIVIAVMILGATWYIKSDIEALKVNNGNTKFGEDLNAWCYAKGYNSDLVMFTPNATSTGEFRCSEPRPYVKDSKFVW